MTNYYSSPFVLSSLLLLSVPILFFLGPRLLPPKTLPSIPDSDEITDLALFRRAILASNSSSLNLPHRPSPKIAFLFLTYSDLHFAPLWEKFFQNHSDFYNIYVHADPTTKFLNPISPLFKNRFIPSKPTQRASPTLISAARRLLAFALLDDPSNSYFALISQTCIPLHSFNFAYRSLLSRPHKSFIEIIADDPGLYTRYIARGENIMLPEIPFERFRVGSQFFALTRKHAVMVVRDRRLWKKFKKPCLMKMKDSCYPEEHYFPTLLDLLDPKGCTGYTLTRVNWTDSVEGHPHLYKAGEVDPGLIWELRRSNSSYEYLFARKFSPECLEPLMKIADDVMLKD
ncbi:hypothetical protein LUZ60_005162 [Juncus effusus]|nr:hypothetical protein LUZ60_005162 [Juncus effusus]